MTNGERITTRELDARVHPCGCTKHHVPALRITHQHHILPLSWGGSDRSDNKVPLCPTGHSVVHVLLDQWKKSGGPGPRGTTNRYLYNIAIQGWQKTIRARRRNRNSQ